MSARLISALSISMLAILSNVLAYVIYLSAASDSPSEVLIFFSLLVPALCFKFVEGGESGRTVFSLAMSREFFPLLPYGALLSFCLYGYNYLFWNGFIEIRESNTHTGLVLSLLSASIVISPLISNFRRTVVTSVDLQSAGQTTISQYKVTLQFIAVLLFVIAAFFFNVDLNTINDLGDVVGAIKNSFYQPPTLLLVFAIFVDALKDRVQISISDVRGEFPAQCGGTEYESKEHAELMIQVAVVQGSLFGSIFAFFHLMTVDSGGVGADLWASVHIIPIICVFVVFGFFVKHLAEAKLKSMKFKMSAMHALFSLRPAVFVIVGWVSYGAFSSISCIGEECNEYLIAVSNPFKEYSLSALIGIGVTILACLVLLVEFIGDGFFESRK